MALLAIGFGLYGLRGLDNLDGPTLQRTAVACFVSGVAVARRGLARPDLSVDHSLRNMGLPDFVAVLPDGPVRRKLSGSRRVQHRNAGPARHVSIYETRKKLLGNSPRGNEPAPLMERRHLDNDFGNGCIDLVYRLDGILGA